MNAMVPGLVTGTGEFDPQDPGIAEINALYLDLQNDAIEDLSGIEHLHALEVLSIVFFGTNALTDTCRIQVVPPSLRQLSINSVSGHTLVGELPEGMDRVQLSTPYSMMYVGTHIDRIGDGLGQLALSCAHNITWGDTAYVTDLELTETTGCQPWNFALPPVVCETFRIEGSSFVIDQLNATAVQCERIFLNGFNLVGAFLWPPVVGTVNLNYTSSGTIPNWPQQVDSIRLTINAGMCIPALPNSLEYFEFHENGGMSCIPNWPDEMVTFLIDGQEMDQSELTYCSVLNSNCPGAYPALAGLVRMDLNNNGIVDVDEPIVPTSSVTIAPGGQYTGCAPDGSWQLGVPPGEHTITVATGYPYAGSVSPSLHYGSVPSMGDMDLNNDFAVAVLPDIQDLRVQLYALPARPGFDNQVYLRCENYGTTVVDAEFTFSFDADQTWLGSTVAPTSTSGNTATWSFPAMPIGAVQNIVVELNTAPIVPLGTDIVHTLSADPIPTDESPLNNVYTFNDSVVGSYDPNDKLLFPAVLTPDEVALGETPIEYTIRFQNTGTFLAERVVILDTLSTDLQWESMRFIASSHAHHWYITNGVLHVIHNDIMLPDSNANEAASHGFFKFSMLPKTDLDNGSLIENIAHIVFDFNEPIVTEPAVFMVDISAGVTEALGSARACVFPNPSQEFIQVNALGTDDVLRYHISDMLGAQVQAGSLVTGDWLNVENLDPGTYLICIDHGRTRIFNRFVKQ